MKKNSNDQVAKPISVEDETSLIPERETPYINPIPPIPALETTNLYFAISAKEYERFLDVVTKFYLEHRDDLDDVSISTKDVGQVVTTIDTRFVEEFKKYMSESGYVV